MRRSHRHVAVILNQDVDGVGFAGELINARAGFARNFLLTGGRAEIATPQRRQQRTAELAKAEERRAAEVAKLEDLRAKLEAAPIQLTLKTGPNNRVFGSVTAAVISKTLKEQLDAVVPTTQLHGRLPLKQLGSHQVSAKLGLGVTALLNVNISGERSESEDSA